MSRLRERTTATLLIAIFMISAFTVAHSLAEGDDVYIDEYRATFYPNGTLVEEYTYEIRVKKFRMLCRLWAVPLSADSLNRPYIEPLAIEAAPGAIGYYKDYTGWVSVNEPYKDNWTLINTISSLAYSNEVGSFKPDYYEPGRYTVQYTFDIHPPLEYDDDTGHLNLMFASEHIPYRSVIIVFEDSEYIDALYPHPISYKVSKEDDRIVVTGSSGEDELIEVEMLIDLDALETMDGFPTWVEGVRFRTVIANIDMYENFEKMYSSLLLNFTRLQEDLDEANLEISSTRSELDLVELELEEKRSELNKAYDKITTFQVVTLVAFVAGLSLMYIISKRGKVIP